MKIGIIGAGTVGATAAYALVMRGIGREIVLVDLNAKRAQAEADDLTHATPFAHPVKVRAGGYADLAGAAVVIVTAGVAQKPGETRLELLERNAAVFHSIVPSILKHAPDAVLVVATNPVDIMTHLAAREAAAFGVPSRRVIGSGTTLDTARFRTLLGQHIGVDPHHVHAYVLGEHGDSEVLAWSEISIGGIPLDEFCVEHGQEVTDAAKQQIDEQVRNAAYHIIDGKGATYYGIGSALAQIVNVILRDQRSLLTICTPLEDVCGVPEVTVALPNLVGGAGVLSTCLFSLSDAEYTQLRASAQIVRDAIMSLDAKT
ncbi:MAG: L-lactate dehydrogenase [Anaerolineae bacterium]|nr:L-lactate dehydrogenase [Anaerolineae bacterium]